MSTFGSRLRYARERKELSQKDAATLAGISNQALCRYETDYTQPDTDVIMRLALLYNVSADYLLGIVDDIKKTPASQEDGLSKDEREIIRLYSEATPETRYAMLLLLRAAEAAAKAPDGGAADKRTR